MKKIAIFSVPRSGSSWLGQIFNSSPEILYRFQPNFSYSFQFNLIKESNKDQIKDFHTQLIDCNDPFVSGQLSISGSNNPDFPKEEIKALVWKEVHQIYLAKTLLENSDTTVIGLIRSPLAVISSWIKIPKEFDPSWSVISEWKLAELKNDNNESNYFGYEKWKEVAILFEELKKKYPTRFYLLKYDDLLSETIPTVKDLFQFTGLTMSNQTEEFLQKSTSTSVEDAYGVFKKKVSDLNWKEELPVEIIGAIQNDLRGTTLEKYLK